MRALGVLVALCCAAWIAFRWSALGPIWLVYDDAFYYFAIARNIAHGAGSTFDGIHATNGYHPLWLLVCIVPYALGLGDDAAVKVLLTLSTILMGAATLLGLRTIFRHGKNLLTGAAFVLFIFCPWSFWRFSNGLEAPCTLLFFALLVDRMDGRDVLSTRRERFVLSLLACGLFLSRTDGIFLVPWLAGWTLVRTKRIAPAIDVALAPSIAIGAYLVFNKIAYGTPTQVSGDLKRVMPTFSGALIALAMALAPIAVIVICTRLKPALIQRTVAFVLKTAPLLGYVACVGAYYDRLQLFAWPWYYVGPIFYSAIVGALVAIDLGASERRPMRIFGHACAAIVSVLCLRMLAYVGDKSQYTLAETNVVAGRWIKDNIEGDAVFASWDSGAIGYYSHKRVLCLDGEVSSPEYIRALKGGDPIRWTKDQRFDYVVNVQDQEDGAERMRNVAATYLGEDRVKDATVVRTWPFVFHGYTNRHAPGEHPMAVFLLRLREAK